MPCAIKTFQNMSQKVYSFKTKKKQIGVFELKSLGHAKYLVSRYEQDQKFSTINRSKVLVSQPLSPFKCRLISEK
jgi:hypothetical protein